MTVRRRNSFPGLGDQAQRELISLQDELIEELRQLRGEAVGITTDTKTRAYSARFNERICAIPPAAGIAITFPASGPLTQNRWIEVLKLGGGDVRIRATSGTVQGVTTHTLTANGFYYYQSDGKGGWWIQPSSGGGATWAATLVLGNTSGGTAVNLTGGSEFQVAGSPGALGNVFTSQGPGVSPVWAAAAGGSFSLLTTEVNLGTGGVSGSFTIAGAGMTPGRPVLCVQAVGPYTGKGALEDVAEEPVWCTAAVTSAILITVYWQSSRPVGGNVKFNYAVG